MENRLQCDQRVSRVLEVSIDRATKKFFSIDSMRFKHNFRGKDWNNESFLFMQIKFAYNFKVYFRYDFIIKIDFKNQRLISILHTEIFNLLLNLYFC